MSKGHLCTLNGANGFAINTNVPSIPPTQKTEVIGASMFYGIRHHTHVQSRNIFTFWIDETRNATHLLCLFPKIKQMSFYSTNLIFRINLLTYKGVFYFCDTVLQNLII